MQVMTVVMLVSILMKSFALLKVMPSIGSFTAVTYSIMGSTAQFLLFFFSWVILFTFLYMLVGIRLENPTQPDQNFYENHSRYEILQSYMLLAIKNSVTGPEDPTDNFWSRLSYETADEYPAIITSMNSMILFIWMVGIVLLLVFLLNLNISILGDAFSEYSNLKEQYTFKQQAVMNKECNLVLGSFPLKLFFGTSRFVDCIIISSASQKKVDEKDRKSNEVIKGIKELVEQQNQKYK